MARRVARVMLMPMPIFAAVERLEVGGGVLGVGEGEDVEGEDCEVVTAASAVDVSAVEDMGIDVVIGESEVCAEVDVVVAAVDEDEDEADEDDELEPFATILKSELVTRSPNLVPLTMMKEKMLP